MKRRLYLLRFVLEIMIRENIMIPCFRSYFVSKRLAVGNLCHVLGEPTQKKVNFQLAKRAETKAIKRPSTKPNELVKKYSKETNARKYATAK